MPASKSPKPPKQVEFCGETLGKEDKWKLASQLQKAIRRGLREDASQAARALYELEGAYARYRLAVIMVEDVGAADPGLVLKLGEGGWKKADIEARGGIDFIENAAAQLAAAPKDRTPCQALACVYWLREFEDKRGSFAQWDISQAMEWALDVQQPWQLQALAAWRCIGTDKLKSGALPEVAGDPERFTKQVARQISAEAGALVHWGLLNQIEAHPIGIALSLGADRTRAQLTRPSLTDLGRSGPWLSAALDRHTAEGKRALGRALDRAGAREWFAERGIGAEVGADAVGRLWFWMEGGQCDPLLIYPTSHAIDRDIKARYLNSLGVSGQELMQKWGTKEFSSILAAERTSAISRPTRPRY